MIILTENLGSVFVLDMIAFVRTSVKFSIAFRIINLFLWKYYVLKIQVAFSMFSNCCTAYSSRTKLYHFSLNLSKLEKYRDRVNFLYYPIICSKEKKSFCSARYRQFKPKNCRYKILPLIGWFFIYIISKISVKKTIVTHVEPSIFLLIELIITNF